MQSSQINYIEETLSVYRDSVVQQVAIPRNYASNTVTQRLYFTEYGSANWEVLNKATTVYTDGTSSSSQAYDSQYFSVP